MIRALRIFFAVILLTLGLPVFMALGAVAGAGMAVRCFPIWAGLRREKTQEKPSKDSGATGSTLGCAGKKTKESKSWPSLAN